MSPRAHSVCVVGLGGLGCPASLALLHARKADPSSLRRLTLIDPDLVDVTNLHRQLWHGDADLGRPKVESAAQKIRQQFQWVAPVLAVRQERVTAAQVDSLFAEHDLVIDATDHVDTKFLLNDAAVRSGASLVYGGVVRFEGLALRIERGGPCLRCLFEAPPVDALTCAQAGVLGALPQVVGAWQAVLADQPNAQPGVAALQVLDGWALRARTVRVTRRPDCFCAAFSPVGKK